MAAFPTFQIFTLLVCYAAWLGNQLTIFSDTLSVPSSKVRQCNKKKKKEEKEKKNKEEEQENKKKKKEEKKKNPSSWTALSLKIGPIDCPTTQVTNYAPTLYNIQKKQRSHLRGGGNLQSCVPYLPKCKMNLFLSSESMQWHLIIIQEVQHVLYGNFCENLRMVKRGGGGGGGDRICVGGGG